jgi:hypothetical protein
MNTDVDSDGLLTIRHGMNMGNVDPDLFIQVKTQGFTGGGAIQMTKEDFDRFFPTTLQKVPVVINGHPLGELVDEENDGQVKMEASQDDHELSMIVSRSDGKAGEAYIVFKGWNGGDVPMKRGRFWWMKD